MDTSQENPMLRFKAFWLALSLMLLFAVVGAVYRASHRPGEELDDAAGAKRVATLAEIRTAQSKSVTDWGLSYTDPQGGHLPTIRVPDTLIAKAVDSLKANPGHKTEQIVLGSKTFLDQQSKTHDPTESFLNK